MNLKMDAFQMYSLTMCVLLFGSGDGQDEFMTCSRPTKTSRNSRQHNSPPTPCDNINPNESWCNLPGPFYPWHAVRRFVFENQGLMRRMYGEVRQLSVLRMEFSGDENYLDESRDFDSIFKPITTQNPSHFKPMAEQSLLENIFLGGTTENAPTLVVTSSILSEEPITSSTSSASSLETEPDLTTEEPPTTTISPTTLMSEEGTTVEMVTEEESKIEKNRNEGQEILLNDDSSDKFIFKDEQIPSSTPPPQGRNPNRQGVNACPVKEEVVAPYWANNTRGEVLALLNLYPFEQYIHWEKCTNENRQMFCRDGCRCEQQYRLHRLLAFDPHNECRGIFSDWFRFPSCCVCKCYFDDILPERISFNRSPRRMEDEHVNFLENSYFDSPDVNGIDTAHFFYKNGQETSFRQPRK